MGKGENAGYQHFLLFPQCLQKASYKELLENVIVWLRVKGFLSTFSSKGWKFVLIVITCGNEFGTVSKVCLGNFTKKFGINRDTSLFIMHCKICHYLTI